MSDPKAAYRPPDRLRCDSNQLDVSTTVGDRSSRPETVEHIGGLCLDRSAGNSRRRCQKSIQRKRTTFFNKESAEIVVCTSPRPDESRSARRRRRARRRFRNFFFAGERPKRTDWREYECHGGESIQLSRRLDSTMRGGVNLGVGRRGFTDFFSTFWNYLFKTMVKKPIKYHTERIKDLNNFSEKR